MGDLTQVQLLPVESGTAKRGEPDLTEQEIALIVTAGGGRYVGLLRNNTLRDTEGLAVLANCPDVIEAIPQLQRDEKNIEDAQKEGNELYLDVCESWRDGVMSYASEQKMPREVELQERIKKIENPTQKYMEYLRLAAKPREPDMVFSMSRRCQ